MKDGAGMQSPSYDILDWAHLHFITDCMHLAHLGWRHCSDRLVQRGSRSISFCTAA